MIAGRKAHTKVLNLQLHEDVIAQIDVLANPAGLGELEIALLD